MKTRQRKLIGVLVLSASIFLVSILLYGKTYGQRNQNESFDPTPPQANPLGPHVTEPLPNGTKISFAEAQTKAGQNGIPIPNGIDIQETWITDDGINSERQSIAIKFDGDLLLIIHHMVASPNWDGIISSTPELMKVTVNGNTGVGTDPGATHYSGRDYPYPGSVSWWMDGFYLTLYSDTMSLQELLKIAETVH